MKSIRIGTHGSRGSGKTCYYAALYGKRTEGDITINLSTDETVGVLESDWRVLSNGERPEATAQALPKKLHLSVTVQGKVSAVSAFDYAGSLVQRGEADAPKLKETVLEWMKECDALLLFVDTERILSPSPDELREQQTEIGLLLSALQKGKIIYKPLAIVLTKWDLYSDELLSVDEEKKKARAFVEQHELLGQIATGIKLSGSCCEVFPVSAFGGHRNGGALPPSGGIIPFNTLAPLAWCVECVREIRCVRKKRRSLFRGAIVALGFFLVIMFMNHLAESYVETVMQSMTDLSISIQDVRSNVESCRKHWNPLTRTSRRQACVDEKYAKYQHEKESADFERLEEPFFRDSKSELKQKQEAYETFMVNWSASTNRVDVEGYSNKAEEILKIKKTDAAFGAKVEDLFRSVETKTDLESQRKLLDDFLNDNPRNKVPDTAHHELDRVIFRHKDVLSRIRDDRWKAVSTYCDQNADQYTNCIEKLEDYLKTSTDAEYKKFAQDKKKSVEILWDKNLYQQLQKTLDKVMRNSVTVIHMRSLKRQMEEYRNLSYPPPKMKDVVNVWLRWFDKVERGASMDVYINRIEVPSESWLNYRLDNIIALRMNVGSHKIKEVKTKKTKPTIQVNFDKRLSGISYKFGDELKLQVKSRWGWIRGLPGRNVDVEIQPVSRQVDLTHKGKRVGTLYMHVADQPELSDYKDW